MSLKAFRETLEISPDLVDEVGFTLIVVAAVVEFEAFRSMDSAVRSIVPRRPTSNALLLAEKLMDLVEEFPNTIVPATAKAPLETSLAIISLVVRLIVESAGFGNFVVGVQPLA